VTQQHWLLIYLSSVNGFTVVGLLYDMLGVATMAWPIVSTGHTLIADLSRKWMFGRNPREIESMCKQWFDTLWGLVWLFAGFTLQLVGSLNPRDHRFAWLIALPALALTFLLMVASRGRVVQGMVTSILAAHPNE
jgi:hypothetical protein